MIRVFILCFALLGSVTKLSAQSLDSFKQQLAQPASTVALVDPASVRVTEHGDAARAVADAVRDSQRTRVHGYRVCIYIDNGQSGQDARAGAEAAAAQFAENFPDIQVDPVYENPYFKVKVGNCLTREEAIMLKGRVVGLFPKAFTTREELTLNDFID